MRDVWKFLTSTRFAVVIGIALVLLLGVGVFVGHPRLIAFPAAGALLALLFAALFVSLVCCTIDGLVRKRCSVASFLCHAGVLTVLVGGAVSVLTGERGVVLLYEGESVETFRVERLDWWGIGWLKELVSGEKGIARGGVSRELGFKVRLDDFSVDLYPPEVRCFVDNAQAASVVPANGMRMAIAEGTYTVAVDAYYPDYAIVEQLQGSTPVRTEISRSVEAKNPVVRMRIIDPAGQEEPVLLMAAQASHHRSRDGRLTLVYSLYDSQRAVRSFKSKVTVLQRTRPLQEGVVEVNRPFSYKGFSFYQSSYDPDDLSATYLSVVRDPGTGVVYIGFGLLALGLTWFAMAGRRGDFRI
ncbi:MAG: cytochrome c biogenesis protein ResB [Planctomycetota bacterium]|nr:cytochrome c biogenesis protein ResB [Planctomycetota bacterium]